MVSGNQSVSAFIKLLNQVSSGPQQRIGFRTLQTQPLPALVVVVTLPGPEPQLAEAAARGGAGALLVSMDGEDASQDAGAIHSLLQAAGGIPCGALLTGTTRVGVKRIESWRSAGIDFVVMGVDSDPAYLEISGLGKIITVDHTVTADQLRMVNDLPLDAVEASLEKPDEVGQTLVIRDVLRYRALSAAVHKPIIVRADKQISPGDVAALREARAEGLTIDLRQTGSDKESIQKTTSDFVQAIKALGSARGRGGAGLVPMIPRAGSPQVVEEPDEEPDEE